MEQKNKIALGVGAAFLLYVLSSKGKKSTNSPVINDIVNLLEKHPTKVYPIRDLNGVTEIILHHYAGSGTPYNVAHYHVNTRDWAGIGYHYTIDKDGTISLVNYHQTYSNQTYNHNYKSIGVALEGNFQNENPTAAQMASLNALIPYIRSKFNHPLEVYQHSDFANKPYDASLDLTPYKLANVAGIYNDYEPFTLECNDHKFTDSLGPGSCSYHKGILKETNDSNFVKVPRTLKDISNSEIESFFYKDYQIAEYLKGHRIDLDSFKRYGDKNLIREKLHWLKKGGFLIDDTAQSLTWSIGIEVTPEDIIRIILDSKSAKAYIEELRYQTYLILSENERGVFGINAIYKDENCLIGTIYKEYKEDLIPCQNGRFTSSINRGACSYNGGVSVFGKKKKEVKEKDISMNIAKRAAKINLKNIQESKTGTERFYNPARVASNIKKYLDVIVYPSIKYGTVSLNPSK